MHVSEVVGTANPMAALIGCVLQVSINLMFLLWPLHWLLRLVVPKPHDGPSRATQLLGHWKSVVVGKGVGGDGNKATPPLLYAIMGDARDPGYWHTARVVLEAGLCLADIANGRAEGPALAAGGAGGVLTPASAMGDALIVRLRRAGVTMVVREPGLPVLSAEGAPVGLKSGPATGANKEA